MLRRWTLLILLVSGATSDEVFKMTWFLILFWSISCHFVEICVCHLVSIRDLGFDGLMVCHSMLFHVCHPALGFDRDWVHIVINVCHPRLSFVWCHPVLGSDGDWGTVVQLDHTGSRPHRSGAPQKIPLCLVHFGEVKKYLGKWKWLFPSGDFRA